MSIGFHCVQNMLFFYYILYALQIVNDANYDLCLKNISLFYYIFYVPRIETYVNQVSCSNNVITSLPILCSRKCK